MNTSSLSFRRDYGGANRGETRMRNWAAAILGLVFLLAGPALAAPADPAQRDAALAVFNAWNKAVAAGKLNDALALRSADRRARISKDMKTAAQRRQVGEMLKAMLPDTVEVLHAAQNKDGSKMTLYTVVGRTVPPGQRREGMPPPGTRLQAEVALDFLREGGTWKFDNQTWGMDPSKLKPCTSTFSGMDAFEERDNLQMGGQIRRVDFAADHTKVVIRMLDEENCIFLPSKARLTELGFDSDWLQPYAIIEIAAWPHRQDKQAVWAENITVLDDE